MLPTRLSSDSKEVLAMTAFARLISNHLPRHLRGELLTPLFSMRCFEMSHARNSLTPSFSLVAAVVLCAFIVTGLAEMSHAGDNDGIGGFKYKFKMEGDEESVEFGGIDLLRAGNLEGPEGPETLFIEDRVPQVESRIYLVLAKFQMFLMIRH